MNADAILDAGPALAWPADDAVVLAVTDGAGYNQAVLSLARELTGRLDQGVFLTANRPSEVVRDNLGRGGIETGRIFFIDSVSSLTGMPPVADDRVMHIESPTLLEKMVMRTDQVLRRMQGRRFLVVDSLSSLAVYNGALPVSEMVHALVTRLRMQGVGAALLLVERQSDGRLLDTVRPLCDAVVRLGAAQG